MEKSPRKRTKKSRRNLESRYYQLEFYVAATSGHDVAKKEKNIGKKKSEKRQEELFAKKCVWLTEVAAILTEQTENTENKILTVELHV